MHFPSLPRCGLFQFAVLFGFTLQPSTPVVAHDTFFRVPNHHVAVGEPVEVSVFHGTFDESVLRIDTDHVEKLVFIGPGIRQDIGTSNWVQVDFGSRPWVKWQALRASLGFIDKRLTSHFSVMPPVEGSYVVAMSLNPAGAAMAPEVFDKYLREQGLQDEAVARHGIAAPNAIITERWLKYVKLFLQAGKSLTPEVTRPAGLVVEFVPLTHPAEARPGDTVVFQLLYRGKPLPDQPVIVGRPTPAFGEAVTHDYSRSDDKGLISVPIDEHGVWWLSFVHIIPLEDDPEFAWESRWATLTFEIP